MSKLSFSRSDIHVYLDGEMPPEERLRFEDWLEENPEALAELHAFETLNSQLHDAFDGVLDEPLPAAHEKLFAGRNDSHPVVRWRQIAAAVAMLLIGGFGGFLIRDSLGGFNESDGRFVADAFYAHDVFVPEVVHPVEVAATNSDHLTKWLSKRLGNEVRAPELSSEGYRFVGGRLLPGEKLPAAQLMYEDARGLRLTLYLTPAGKATNSSFSYFSRNQLSAYVWTDKPFHYAMIGDMSRDRMDKICKVVYAFLES